MAAPARGFSIDAAIADLIALALRETTTTSPPPPAGSESRGNSSVIA